MTKEIQDAYDIYQQVMACNDLTGCDLFKAFAKQSDVRNTIVHCPTVPENQQHDG